MGFAGRHPQPRTASRTASPCPETFTFGQIRDTIEPGIAFDVGAHVGNHSLFLAAAGFDVYAWEPYEPSRRLLHANLRLNPHLNVRVFPWAAGDRDTVGRFTKGMWLEFDPTRTGATMKVDRGDVPVHRIDDRINVDGLAVVKVDVEGMEPHVLRGMRRLLRKHLPVVYAETHTDEKESELRSVLEPLGYTLTERIKKKGALRSREAIEVARQVAAALAYAHKRSFVHRD